MGSRVNLTLLSFRHLYSTNIKISVKMVDIQPNHEITRFFLIDKNHKALGKFYVKFYGFYLLEETWTVIISMKGTTKFAATQ